MKQLPLHIPTDGPSSMNVNQQFPTGFQRPLTKRSLSTEEEEFLDKPVTDFSNARISQRIKYWKNVANGLALTQVDIVHLESKYKSESVSEQTFQMLYRWKRTSAKTSFRLLVDVLKKCEEIDAVNYILDNLGLLTDPQTRYGNHY